MFADGILAPAFCISFKKICEAHALISLGNGRQMLSTESFTPTFYCTYGGLPAHLLHGTGKLLLHPHPNCVIPILCISIPIRKKNTAQ